MDEMRLMGACRTNQYLSLDMTAHSHFQEISFISLLRAMKSDIVLPFAHFRHGTSRNRPRDAITPAVAVRAARVINSDPLMYCPTLLDAP